MDMNDAEGISQFRIYPPQEEIDPREAYTWGHLWLKKISVNPYMFVSYILLLLKDVRVALTL